MRSDFENELLEQLGSIWAKLTHFQRNQEVLLNHVELLVRMHAKKAVKGEDLQRSRASNINKL